eukprot:4365928-Alexandrium_andersonii.AAC.1
MRALGMTPWRVRRALAQPRAALPAIRAMLFGIVLRWARWAPPQPRAVLPAGPAALVDRSLATAGVSGGLE